MKTLETIRGRLGGSSEFGGHEELFVGTLDEAVFGLDGVIDYAVEIEERGICTHEDHCTNSL